MTKPDTDTVSCTQQEHTPTPDTTEVPSQTKPNRSKPKDEPVGNVLPVASETQATAGDNARESWKPTMLRLMRLKNWPEITRIRDQMMRDVKKQMPDLNDRRTWVYGELDRMYPPVQPSDQGITTYGEDSDMISETPHLSPLVSTKAPSLTDGQIQGLSDLPGGWPELPANAALASEVGWVQANRLRVVSEKPSGASVVRLDQALSPAPSWAALGWLETSIRSYAKFVDVASKVSGGAEDEGAVMKRERRSVEDVRALLDDMMEAEGTCPSCGRPID